jgi:deazaflavin-dependent oxidoreductase (nitroreductase family)
MADEHYKKPGWFTRNIFNRAVALATRLGVSVWGSRILQVRGRKTGELRETPVNLLTHEGNTYLVAPRGTTQWVRNLRAADEGVLRVGRHTQQFHPEELPNEAKPDILRAFDRHALNRMASIPSRSGGSRPTSGAGAPTSGAVTRLALKLG